MVINSKTQKDRFLDLVRELRAEGAMVIDVRKDGVTVQFAEPAMSKVPPPWSPSTEIDLGEKKGDRKGSERDPLEPQPMRVGGVLDDPETFGGAVPSAFADFDDETDPESE